jgi:hypothetical protein
MRDEKTRRTWRWRKTGIWIITSLLALIVVLILLVVFLVPWFVSSERGRVIILAKINDTIEGKMYFAGLSMGWRDGIKITELSFNDSSGQILVEAKQIVTKPRYGSILSGGLSLGGTIVDKPRVEINLKDNRTKKAEGSRQQIRDDERKAAALPIKKVEMIINDGYLKAAGRGAEAVEVSGINSELTMSIDFCSECPSAAAQGLIANLETEAKIGFEQARYFGLNFGPTEVELRIRKSLLVIKPFSTMVNNGQLKFAGEADFGLEPVLLKTVEPIQIVKAIQINDETTRKFLMYLNPVFAKAVNVSGEADFHCERLAIPLVGGDENNLEVVGTISINKLRLDASELLSQILSAVGTSAMGQDITILPTRFTLQNGLLRYDDMQMVVGDNPVNFKGSIGLDKSLDMTVVLPYTLKGRTARVGRETIGERISIPLKGTIDKPELDLEKLLEEQLKSQLRQRLGDELKGQLQERLKDELKKESTGDLLKELEGLFKK